MRLTLHLIREVCFGSLMSSGFDWYFFQAVPMAIECISPEFQTGGAKYNRTREMRHLGMEIKDRDDKFCWTLDLDSSELVYCKS